MSVSIFICRHTSDRATCTGGCGRLAITTCSFALGGKKTGQTCGRALCSSCGPNGVCPPHQRLVEKKAGSPAFPRI